MVQHPSSSSDSSSAQGSRKVRSLRDIYEATEEENNLNLFCFYSDCDPLSYEEAAQEKKWRNAMDEEIKSIEKNNTWALTKLLEGCKAIGVKWVYKTKKNSNGEVQR